MKIGVMIIFFVAFAISSIIIFIGVYLYNTKNLRIIRSENIRFEAPLKKNEKPKYGYIRVGTADKPYLGSPSLYIKMPDGYALGLHDAGYDDLVQHSLRHYDIYDAPSGWAKGSIIVVVGYYRFIVHNNKIKSVIFSAKGTGNYRKDVPAPAIGKESSQLYVLPLSEDEVYSIMGGGLMVEEVLRE